MKKFYLIILFAFLASFGSYITAAEKTITYTFTTKDWNATDQDGIAANWVSGGSASSTLDKTKGIPVYKAQYGANATSPISFNNIKKVVLIWGTSSNGVGDIVLTVGGEDQTKKTVSKSKTNQSYAVTFDTPVNGKVKFTVNCTTSTIFIKSVAVTYEEAAADQVATPKFDFADGYSSFKAITASATTTTEGATVHYSYTKNGEPQTLADDKQAPVLSTVGTYVVTAIAKDDANGTLKDSYPATATYIITAPAVPTAEPKPGTYSEATIIKFTSPEGTIVRVKRGNEYFTPVKNIFTKELTAVGGEKTTYTFEVWTEYNDNNSDRVFYTYIIDPSYVHDSYTLCTDIKYLTPGTKVIFVGSKTDGTDCQVMTDFNTDKNYRNADATNVMVSDDGNTLDDIGNAVVFTVAYDGSATDDYKYSFYDSESNYLGSGTGSNNMTNQTAEGGIIPDKAKWSISLDANKNYNATILAKKYYSTYPYLRYNSGSPRFACYQSSFGAGYLRIYFNEKTSGVEKVALTDKKAKVYGAAGNIVVEAEAAADVNVYNAAGMLVAAQKVGAGRTNIALAKGFYVVRAGNTVTKVAVR
ncbi:MAG: hypothetical protein PUE39_08980 [bacterium]|nr:hypothetical protein [bacterium]